MTRSAPLALLLGLALGLPAAAAPYEDLDTGYRLEIPPGWRHHFDMARGALVMRGPGGVRVQLRARSLGEDEAPGDPARAFRTQGRRFLRRYPQVGVRRRPTTSQVLGDQPTTAWSFRFRTRKGRTGEALTWLAWGPSEARPEGLEVRLAVLGPREALARGRPELAALLGSFEWPRSLSVDEPSPGQRAIARLFDGRTPAWIEPGPRSTQEVPVGTDLAGDAPAVE